MSKSRGNVINPDDILADYGADALRLYEMFMGPLEMTKPWSTKGVEGVYRFLGRVWRLFIDEESETEFEQNTTAEPNRAAEFLEKIRINPAIKEIEPSPAQLKALHACIKKVTEDLDGLRFNTAISALMIFINEAMTWEAKPARVLREFLILLQPFAPHVAEELWSKMSKMPGQPTGSPAALDRVSWTDGLAYAPWPAFDPSLLVEETMEIPVQVNGKLRDVIQVPANASRAELEAAALKAEKAQPFLTGKTVRKIIVVPKKMVNIVVG
jgi:leucyl-tRNA synthetase